MSPEKKIKTYNIFGMHCRSCEMLVEEKIKELPGIKEVKVSASKGIAEVHFLESLSDEAVANSIKEAGFKIGTNKVDVFLKNTTEWKQLGLAAIIFLILFLVFKSLGLSDLLNISVSNEELTPLVVILIGLTAGISTCMALVGGLVLGVASKYASTHSEAKAFAKFKPHLFFNLGRILGFGFFGSLLGGLGSFFKMSPSVLGVFTIIVAFVMLFIGLQLLNIFPILNRFSFVLPKKFSRLFFKSKKGQLEKDNYSHIGTMVTGGLTFFLPCGFTQAMQLYAVMSGSALSGAAIMAFFALGTAPGLLSVAGIASIVKGRFGKIFFKVMGFVVLIFALFNLSNGYNLFSLESGGISLNLGNNTKNSAITNTISTDPNVEIKDGVQVVYMAETKRGYEPDNFTIKKDLPVKWIIDAQAPYSCASALILPKFNIRKNLEAGENIIEFTPDSIGRLKFSCSMGMYTGYFDVVE
jgi:sulfite exporter TauE/SafE/copper chaperone CopZ